MARPNFRRESSGEGWGRQEGFGKIERLFSFPGTAWERENKDFNTMKELKNVKS
jgi:hypothetical protein